MTAWIEPPPPQRGMGCFAKGCLILCGFFILLTIAFAAGSFYAVRFMRTSFFPPTPVQLPANTASPEEQQRVQIAWSEFERRARAHEPARIELTADEINALIASERDLRGKAFVSIEDNTGRLQLSFPLNEVSLLRDRYMNAECTIRSAPNGDPRGIKVTSIVVNGRPVAEEALRWQYGPWSIRNYFPDWTTENHFKTFEIRDGKVILETARGD